MLWRALVPVDEIDLDLRLRTLAILDDGATSVAELLERTAISQEGRTTCGSWNGVLAMIANRLIDFDVKEALSLDSLIWNANSGPPRQRTLPFGTVEDAIRPRPVDAAAREFRGLETRRFPKKASR
jgi:hypothetical protein